MTVCIPVKGESKHSFAFKMVLSDQVVEAKVVDVLWTPSKDGYLKPRIRMEPVHICGVKIEYATAFNAAFVEKHCIALAIVRMVRSGDVIPYIMDVIVPSNEPKMPSEPYVEGILIDVLLKTNPQMRLYY